MERCSLTKKAYAASVGVSRFFLYYRHRLPDKDWALKQRIEWVLREFPSYGHKRLAMALAANKKRVLRVMHLFGIRPYRRRGKKWKKPRKTTAASYPNLLLGVIPQYPGHVWATDYNDYYWSRADSEAKQRVKERELERRTL